MKKTTRERYNRDIALQAVYTNPDHEDLVNQNAGFLALTQEHAANIAEMNKHELIAARNNAGHRVVRDLDRDDIELETSYLGGALAIYARRANNGTLLGEAAFSPSFLDSLDDPELASKATAIFTLATSNKLNITKFADATRIAAFGDSIQTFRATFPQGRESRTESGVAALQVDKFAAENAIIVKEMKRIALDFKKKDEQFYDEIKAAIRIIDLPTSYTAAEGTVATAAKTPIPNATITFTRTDKHAPVQSITTDANGQFDLRLSPGTWAAVVTAAGLATANLAGIILTSGNSTRLDIILAP